MSDYTRTHVTVPAHEVQRLCEAALKRETLSMRAAATEISRREREFFKRRARRSIVRRVYDWFAHNHNIHTSVDVLSELEKLWDRDRERRDKIYAIRQRSTNKDLSMDLTLEEYELLTGE